MAHLLRPHGVHGEALIAPSTDVAGRFAVGVEMQLVEPKSGRRRTIRLTSVRPHGGALRVNFEPSVTREELVALRGATFEVPRSLVPPAPDGSYYHFELIGCRVEDRVHGLLGEVVDVLVDGGGVLLLVRESAAATTSVVSPEPVGEGARKAPAAAVAAAKAPIQLREMLLPFVDHFVVRVDTTAGLIEMDLPVGLVEACASRS